MLQHCHLPIGLCCQRKSTAGYHIFSSSAGWQRAWLDGIQERQAKGEFTTTVERAEQLVSPDFSVDPCILLNELPCTSVM